MKKQNEETKILTKNEPEKGIPNKLEIEQICQKEYDALIRSLRAYLESQPNSETCVKKIRLIKMSLQKRVQREKGKVLTFDEYSFTTMKKLRNEILHNRKIANFTLLEFGNWLWKEIALVYADDVNALYNTLSYIIQTKDLVELEPNCSAEDVTKYFSNIYESKNGEEKSEIIRILIPMVFSRFSEKMKQ